MTVGELLASLVLFGTHRALEHALPAFKAISGLMTQHLYEYTVLDTEGKTSRGLQFQPLPRSRPLDWLSHSSRMKKVMPETPKCGLYSFSNYRPFKPLLNYQQGRFWRSFLIRFPKVMHLPRNPHFQPATKSALQGPFKDPSTDPILDHPDFRDPLFKKMRPRFPY